MECIVCKKTVGDRVRNATYHLLDGTVRQGRICNPCYHSAEVGAHLPSAYDGDCEDCTVALSDEGEGRHLYEMGVGVIFYNVMPRGCPFHGSPEDALVFTVWWNRYCEKHSRRVKSDASG